MANVRASSLASILRAGFLFLATVAAGGYVMADTMSIFDFAGASAVDDWVPINDVVMGGVSTGRLEGTPDGTAAFTGRVSLENNGGFASVRSIPRKNDFGDYSGLELRVRGDGRRYKLNLKTDRSFDGILYRVSFETREGEWQTLRLPFEAFRPSFRGRPVPEAPPLDPSHVTSFGLMISDKQAGPFRLEIAWIRAYGP